NLYGLIQGRSRVTAPVLFHNSVIACLEAEIGEERFTEADRNNFERIATMISPAVQAYREMAALNKINQDLTRFQMGLISNDIEQDVNQITKIIHNVMSPLATGISIEIGFAAYRGVYSQDGHFEQLIKEQLDAELGEEDVAEHL